jgi:hypothetical protein
MGFMLDHDDLCPEIQAISRKNAASILSQA